MMDEIQQISKYILSINKRMRRGKIFFDGFVGINDSSKFYENILKFKINPENILVLSITPDGSNTVIGRIMTKNREIYFFDFDLDDFSYSELEKIESQIEVDKNDSLRNSEFLEEVAANYILDRCQ